MDPTSIVLLTFAASPWPVTFETELPPTPAVVTEYAFAAEPVTPARDLARAFGVEGRPHWDEYLGATFAGTATRSLVVRPDGSALARDTDLLNDLTPIELRSPDELLDDSADLLDQLGLLDVPGVTLLPQSTKSQRVDRRGADGSLETFAIGQSILWRQRIDGYDVFGSGADVALHYGRDHQLAVLSHQIRRLEPVGTLAPITADEAIARWLDRAGQGGPISQLLNMHGALEEVVVQTVEFGYHSPAREGDLEPVWVIRGYTLGVDPQSGNDVIAELIWFEPADPEGAQLEDKWLAEPVPQPFYGAAPFSVVPTTTSR